MRVHLLEKPAEYPGCSGAEGISPITSRIFVLRPVLIRRASILIGQLVKEYSLETVLVSPGTPLPENRKRGRGKHGHLLLGISPNIHAQFYMKSIQENAEIAVHAVC